MIELLYVGFSYFWSLGWIDGSHNCTLIMKLESLKLEHDSCLVVVEWYPHTGCCGCNTTELHNQQATRSKCFFSFLNRYIAQIM
jgi:hypothetical protein